MDSQVELCRGFSLPNASRFSQVGGDKHRNGREIYSQWREAPEVKTNALRNGMEVICNLSAARGFNNWTRKLKGIFLCPGEAGQNMMLAAVPVYVESKWDKIKNNPIGQPRQPSSREENMFVT